MRILRSICVFLLVGLGTSACAELNRQRGVTDVVLDKVMLADSKKMDLLRAEVAMMFLSFVAVDTGGRSGAESIATIAALNRVAAGIDCIRNDAGIGPVFQLTAGKTSECPDVGELYFFDTRMVSVDRDLLSLAKASLPNASLSNLLAALPNATAQPLSLISPILAVARDALIVSQRGLAVYRDAIEVEVDVFCTTANRTGGLCHSERIVSGRDVGEQRTFVVNTIATDPLRFRMTPDLRHFTAARALTAANCQRLVDRVEGVDKSTVNCRISLGNGTSA